MCSGNSKRPHDVKILFTATSASTKRALLVLQKRLVRRKKRNRGSI